MKNLYLDVAEKISQVESVLHVDLWSEQITEMEREHPFPCPAVFLEFFSNGIEDLGNNTQSINMQVDIIVLTETFADTFHNSMNQSEALNFIDVMEKVNAKLHGSKSTSYGGMRRIAISPERLGTAQIAYRMTYECQYADISAASIFTEIEPELNIQNDNKINTPFHY